MRIFLYLILVLKVKVSKFKIAANKIKRVQNGLCTNLLQLSMQKIFKYKWDIKKIIISLD